MSTSRYLTAQICLNGHMVNDSCEMSPERLSNFCPNCGEQTITKCPSCNAPIRGYYYFEGVATLAKTPVPRHCFNCGHAFPWTETSIASLREAIEEDTETTKADKSALIDVIPDMISETPRTQLANARLKRFLMACGRCTKDIVVNLLASIACEYIKKNGLI